MSLIVNNLVGFGGRTAVASGPYSPLDDTPWAWYDASDLTTLWQNTGGTTPVAADGDPVALWQDKSGNGRHLTQSTSTLRPTYKTSGGLHWLEFVNTGSTTKMVGSSAINSASVYCACAHRQISKVGNQRLISLANGSSDTAAAEGIILWEQSVASYQGYASGTKAAATPAPSIGTDVLLESWFDGTNHNMSVNGATAATASCTVTFNVTNLNINGGGGGAANARVYQMVFKLSRINNAALRTYLGNKCGISI